MIDRPSRAPRSRPGRPGASGIAGGVLCVLLFGGGAPPATAQELHAEVVPDSVAADTTGVPQRDLFDVAAGLFGKKPRESELTIKPREGLTLTLLPSIGYNPSYGGYLGVSASVGGWIGDPEKTTLSSGAAGVSYSTSKQLSVYVKSDFYTEGNRYALKGDWRYLDTNQSTFGLGPATNDQDEDPMSFVLYRFYQTLYKRVGDSEFYVGLGYQFNRWDKIQETEAAPGDSTPYRAYSGGAVEHATTSGISFNILRDTRDNPINATSGVYWNASLRTNLAALGSDDSWQGLWSDLRVYPHLPRRSANTLGIWTYAWFTFGHAPYLDLPATGWDTYGRGARGWLQGRIRGQNQLYAEAEYRADLSKDGLFGYVAFLNFTGTTSPEVGNFGRMNPGAGLGLRVKFRKRTATNLALDWAVDQFGVGHFFLGMQEAF